CSLLWPILYSATELSDQSSSLTHQKEAESQNSAEQASLCYFIQESEMESQISCRLRFTRSKFNFNPFGLRFGKREMYSTTNGKSTVFTNNKLLSYVLRFLEVQF
uniref:Kisspeptin n=1 Tax=Erpetoichthys calabaricus TaxID=27687 RepID=A0A8C4S7M3_ERPCA